MVAHYAARDEESGYSHLYDPPRAIFVKRPVMDMGVWFIAPSEMCKPTSETYQCMTEEEMIALLGRDLEPGECFDLQVPRYLP